MRTKPLIGRKAWFGPRRLGWGLSPASAEGWVVTAVAVAAAIGLATADRRYRWSAVLVMLLLLVIVFAKGTSPGGGQRDWEVFRSTKDRDDQ